MREDCQDFFYWFYPLMSAEKHLIAISFPFCYIVLTGICQCRVRKKETFFPMRKAYYWYRLHPYLGKFYPDKTLNLISDTQTFSKYFSDPERINLIKKYFPNGLSPHGLSSMLKRQIYEQDFNEPSTELIFELVRQLHFPDASSRLTSLYASESIAQAEQWYNLFHKNFKGSKDQLPQSLWEIEFETPARLYDAYFLNDSTCKNHYEFSYLTKLENAHRYWQGEFSQHPLPELLVQYPVKVTRLLRNMI